MNPPNLATESGRVIDFSKVLLLSKDGDTGDVEIVMVGGEKLVLTGLDAQRAYCTVMEFSVSPEDIKPDDVAHIQHDFASLGEFVANLKNLLG